MNKIYRIVWNKALHQWVVASEIASASRGGVATTTSPRPDGRLARAGLCMAIAMACLGVVGQLHATDVPNSGFEGGDLTGWTAGGGTGTQASGSYDSSGVGVSVVTGMTDFNSQFGTGAGGHSWTVTPYGNYMASLQATGTSGDANSFTTGAGALGLSAASQQSVADMLSVTGNGAPTDAVWIYQDIALNAGDSFTMAWQYVSTDYTPYNDSSLTSLVNMTDGSSLATVNNQVAQYALLGATNPGTGSYSTDSYGATGWEISTYSVATAGTYRLGFLSFDLADTANSPVLLVDQQPGLTYDHGVPFGPVSPNEGSGAPETPSVPTVVPITAPTNTTDLGTTDGAFGGGTLVADGDTALDQDFTIDDNGGTIDQAGHEVTVTGTITDANEGEPGSLTITNSGDGGGITLSGTNTYTGTTTVDAGATLALAGDGSIADSAGLTDDGTFDIAGANSDAQLASLDGSGTVVLGGNDLDLTDASGNFDGVIEGTGGLTVNGGSESLGGTNTYVGTTTIDEGATLALTGNGSIADSSGVTANGTLDLAGASNDADVKSLDGNGTVALGGNDLNLTDASGNFGGTISGTGGVNVAGGSESFSGVNSYTGGTVIDQGATLALSGGGSIAESAGVTDDGTLDISSAGGDVDITTLDGGGAVVLGGNNLNLTDASGSFGGTIGGSGGVSVQGGTQVLTGLNTYTGGTVIGNGGTLEVGNDASLGAPGSSVTFDDGTLRLDDQASVSHHLVLDGQGTLEVAADDVAVVSGPVSGEGDFVKDGSGALVVDGDLSQTGGVVVNGGLLSLGGNNSYTGDTTLNGGWLQIQDDANLGAATSSLVFNNGGILANGSFDNSHDISLQGNGSIEIDAGSSFATNGEVTGTGTLTKYGDGTLTLSGTLSQTGGLNLDNGTTVLSGDNTYVGTTQVTDGTLQIGSDGNLGDQGNQLSLIGGTLHTTGNVDGARTIGLTGTATFDVDGGTTVSQSGVVVGTGTLVKDGAGEADFSGMLWHTGGTVVNDGTLVLSGDNTYTGGTTLNGGVLQVGSDANLGDASSGLTFDGGTLHSTGSFDTDRAITLAGDGHFDIDSGTTLTATDAMGGAGGLIKQGDGTLVLTGANTYAGGTTIEAGTLQGGSTSLHGDIVDNGTLDFAQDDDGSFSDDISGTGVVRKDGNGSLTLSGTLSQAGALELSGGTTVLSGANTYRGGTSVSNGIVQIDHDGNLGAPGGALLLAGSALHTTADLAGDRDIAVLGTSGFIVDAGTTMTQSGDVSGTGTLVKGGQGVADLVGTLSHGGGTVVLEGTLVLGGNNTYTGGTTIEGGTLQVGADVNLGDASSNLVLDGGELHTTGTFASARGIVLGGGGFTTDAGTTFTSTGVIDGTGALVKNGEGTLVVDGVASHQGGTIVNAGTLVLGGDNTYAGGTTVNGGTLEIGRDANLGEASFDLTLAGGTLHTTGTFASDRDITLGGGAFATNAGSTFTSNGAIAGTGGLVKNGQGTMEVAGVAAHQGGTIVNAGTLILDGANTYTGGTTLNGGSLQIARDANLGDLANDLTFNGGDLTVTQSMANDRDMLFQTGNASITTLAGVTFTAHGDMSGTGGLIKRGGGTLVVSGNNTFTGGTLIDGGVIKIDSGSSLGTGVILLQGGTLQTVETLGTGQTVLVSGNSGVNVDPGKTAVLSGQILTDGTAGCFVKSGQGTLDMTGNATLANGTCVQDGMLRANGELTSQVQVDRIGWLRGVGVIHGSVNVEGALAPGNSPGTLMVSDAVTMHAGSTLEIDVDGHGTGTGAGNYSRLLVGGQFSAAGTLAPTLRGITGNATNTFVPELGDQYTVVQAAGGVSGKFAVLQQPSQGLAANTRFQVFYVDGHAIELFVTPSSYAALLDGQANGNAVRVGAAVDRMVTAQDAGTDSDDQHGLLFALAGLRAAALPQVMHDLSGEAHAQEAAMAREASLGLSGDMADHLAESSLQQGEHGSRAWATLSQGGYRALSDAEASGFHSQQSRTSVGLDAYRGDAALVGVGLAHTEARLEDTPASGNVRGNGALLYGELAAGKALLDGTASWSKDRWATRRADPLAAASGLFSQADGHSMAASMIARFPVRHAGLSIEPYVQATWQRVDRDGFTETGDVLARLTLDRYDATGTRVLAGVKLGSAAQDPLASSVTYRVGAAVGQDFGDTLNPVVDASLAGESFALQAPSMGRTLLKLDANGTLRLGKQSYLYGGLDSATGHDRASYGVNVGVRVQF